MARFGFVELDIVVLERHAGGQIDLDSRGGVSGFRRYLIARRGSQVALVLNHLEYRRSAQSELFLFYNIWMIF